MKRHGIVWWLFIGWWWYLCFAWWVLPIKWLLTRKPKQEAQPDTDRFILRDTEAAILSALQEVDGGSALQVDIKKGLPGRMQPYFDEAVNELYGNGRIKMYKDGSRVRLELVR